MSSPEPWRGSGAPPPPPTGPPASGPPPEHGPWGPPAGPGPWAASSPGAPTGPPAAGPPPEWGSPAPGWGAPQGWHPQPEPAGGAAPPPNLWARFRQRFDEAPVTVSIVVVTVAVWLVHLALQHWAHINTDLTLADNGSGIHGEWWRLFTPMVVHFGILHIGLNMLVLWQLGPPVERVLGARLYLASYLVCGVAGGIVSDIVLKSTALSGGASGAIVGIVGVLVGNTLVTQQLDAWGRRSTQRWKFNPKVARSLAVQIVAWIVLTSLFIKEIDNWAHIGGGVAGMVIGAAVAYLRSEPAVA